MDDNTLLAIMSVGFFATLISAVWVKALLELRGRNRDE